MVRRIASVVGIRPDDIEEYERLHANVWPEVLERLRRSHVTNYSIYRHGEMLFAYQEYAGDDYEADMAAIAADAATQRWWEICQPMQPGVDGLPTGQWKELPEVFHLD